MPITTKQRAQLRGLAMAEDTIIQIGKGGITDSVIASVSAALKARELVKGKVLENSMLTAREACDTLSEACKAEQFLETAGLTGIVLTKLDGTAKGGVVFAIANRLKLPVKFVGVGEGIDDLIPFNPKDYIEALFK